MSIQPGTFSISVAVPQSQRGAALVVGLILLMVLTLLAVSGMTTAALELQMASNEQYQERAFQFADAGIEQAIDAGVYNTNVTIGNYDDLSAVDPVPVRGTGQQIANCPEVGGAEDVQQCEYFLREDRPSNEAATSVCGGQGYSFGTGFQDYYFVIDSYGVSERGALAEHRQSFCVIGPGGT